MMRVARALFSIVLLWLLISQSISAAGPARLPILDPATPLTPRPTNPSPWDAQSTTGPERPPWVAEVGARGETPYVSADAVVLSDVPAYTWHHGCGPTAVGMVVGAWDRRGYDLVPGDAAEQTAAVEQMIASEGPASNYTDYCEPMDASTPEILPDKSEEPIGDEHPDNCVADYMKTSQSRYGNRYGWSFFSDIGPAFRYFVLSAGQGGAIPSSTNLWMRMAPMLTWEAFRAEIDAGRPMVLLVDTNGDGTTDHFVTAIGYDEAGGSRLYACLDTWGSAVRWETFAAIGSGQPWGIYGATLFRLVVPIGNVTVQGPTAARQGEPCTYTATVSPTNASLPVTYSWQADDQAPVTHAINTITDTVTFTWTSSGRKNVRVLISNEGGRMFDLPMTTLVDPFRLYMPLQRRP